MTKEEFLKPRYKVIADYPNQSTAKGNIVNDRVNEHFHITTIQYFDEFGTLVKEANWVTQDEMEKYPAILRKLEWWEEREEKDMPEYVSYVSMTLKERYGNDESKTRKYVQVTSWHKDKNGDWFFNKNPFNNLCSSFLPATKEEYESQTKIQ